MYSITETEMLDTLETAETYSVKSSTNGIYDVFEQNNKILCRSSEGISELIQDLYKYTPHEVTGLDIQANIMALDRCEWTKYTTTDYSKLEDFGEYNPRYGKHLINKIVMENNIKIEDPLVEIVYFDIETYSTNNYIFPVFGDRESRLAQCGEG